MTQCGRPTVGHEGAQWMVYGTTHCGSRGRPICIVRPVWTTHRGSRGRPIASFRATTVGHEGAQLVVPVCATHRGSRERADGLWHDPLWVTRAPSCESPAVPPLRLLT